MIDYDKKRQKQHYFYPYERDAYQNQLTWKHYPGVGFVFMFTVAICTYHVFTSDIGNHLNRSSASAVTSHPIEPTASAPESVAPQSLYDQAVQLKTELAQRSKEPIALVARFKGNRSAILKYYRRTLLEAVKSGRLTSPGRELAIKYLGDTWKSDFSGGKEMITRFRRVGDNAYNDSLQDDWTFPIQLSRFPYKVEWFQEKHEWELRLPAADLDQALLQDNLQNAIKMLRNHNEWVTKATADWKHVHSELDTLAEELIRCGFVREGEDLKSGDIARISRRADFDSMGR